MSRRTNTAVWLPNYSRWQIKVQKDCIRKTFTSYTPGRNGQRECNKKADDWLDNNIVNAKIKVSKAFEDYMANLRLTTSKSNWKPYESFYNKYIFKIGNKKVENLTEQDFQHIINSAYSAGLAKKTLKNIRACLMAFLKYCRSCKYTSLFVEDLKISKNAKIKEKAVLNPSDLIILFQKTETYLYGQPIFDFFVYAYRFQVITGLRPGELIGLKWKDIQNNQVSLQRAINVNGETTKGKNENAVRVFELTQTAKEILQNQRDLMDENKIESVYVFPDKYGNHLLERTYLAKWKRFQKHNEMSAAITLYELRHTFVSMVKKLPEGYLKGLVGHSKDMDTFGVYGHEFADENKQVAVMVQNIIDDIIKSDNNGDSY
jgi:integrase